jgi:hypothetical protein
VGQPAAEHAEELRGRHDDEVVEVRVGQAALEHAHQLVYEAVLLRLTRRVVAGRPPVLRAAGLGAMAGRLVREPALERRGPIGTGVQGHPEARHEACVLDVENACVVGVRHQHPRVTLTGRHRCLRDEGRATEP